MTLQLTTFDILDSLKSEEAIAEYLSQVMADGDDDELLRALGHVAKARGMAQLAKDAGVGRESLYKALKPGATPGYATVGKVVRALGFRMSVKPAYRQGSEMKKAAAAGKKPDKSLKGKATKVLVGSYKRKHSGELVVAKAAAAKKLRA